MSKNTFVEQNKNEIDQIKRIFDELLQFINNNADAKILQKASDVTTFLHKSFNDLDIITKNQIASKSDIYIHPSFKPLTLNVKKALEMVSKFEMLPPNTIPAGSGINQRSARKKIQPAQPPMTSDYEDPQYSHAHRNSSTSPDRMSRQQYPVEQDMMNSTHLSRMSANPNRARSSHAANRSQQPQMSQNPMGMSEDEGFNPS